MLAALVSALALVGGQAAEPYCHGQFRPLTEAEQREAEIQGYMADRAEFGFRADRAYVEALVRRGKFDSDVGQMPVTEREDRYLQRLDEVGHQPGVDRYLRRHPGLSGGLSIEDDWPRGPYLLVRVTERPRFHLTAMKRVARYPDSLQVRKVARSERFLRRLQNRISFRAHRRDGFDVVGAGVDIDANKVEIELITRRTDHAAYFRKRYGPYVKTVVIATEPTSLECAEATYFEIARDGRSLVVHWTTGGGAEFERFELTERADRIEVGVVERVPNGVRTLEARDGHARLRLSAPLGDRPVIDASSRKRLLQHGPSPGEPPCPRLRPPSRLDSAIVTRREYGMRADREHVRRLLRRGLRYTPREERWLRRRERVESATWDGPLARYLERRTDVLSWTAASRFPARPYLLVRATSDRGRHAARLRALAPPHVPVRVVPAEHSAAELQAIVERIEKDAADRFIDGYGDAGFFVESAYVDDVTGEVVVRLRTPRTDHQAFFRARYGPVRTSVEGTRFECRDPFF